MRVMDGAIREARNGGAIHRLIERDHRVTPRLPAAKPAQPIAPIETRDQAYNAILDRLTLSGAHANNLLRRGLSDTEAAHNLYASFPDTQHRVLTVCREAAAVCDLANVPGLYRDYEGRRTWDARLSGMLVPYRDAAGRIQGCQIRLDGGQAKYIWWTSKDRDGGASSGAPIHFARPWRARSTGEAIITEGALKADVIADRLDCAVVAVAGVSALGRNFGEWLRGELPELRAVAIAYDADARTNPQVAAALDRVIAEMQGASLHVERLDWSGAKGLDDLLMGGQI